MWFGLGALGGNCEGFLEEECGGGGAEDEQEFSRKRQESVLPRILVAKDRLLFCPSLSQSSVLAKHSKHGTAMLDCCGSF